MTKLEHHLPPNLNSGFEGFYSIRDYRAWKVIFVLSSFLEIWSL